MSHSADAVAESFAGFIARNPGSALVDDAGEPAVIETPLASGGAAQLAYNAEQAGWVVAVCRSLAQMTDEARAEYLESLVVLTHRVRFGSGQIAGLADDGQISLTTVISGTPGSREIGKVIATAIGLLSIAPVAAGGEGLKIDDLIGEGWIRV